MLFGAHLYLKEPKINVWRKTIKPTSAYKNNIEWSVKIAVSISLLVIVVGIWSTYKTSKITQSKIDQSLRIEQLSQQLNNHYQGLSNALTLAVNSGDKHWKNSYRSNQIILLEKLKILTENSQFFNRHSIIKPHRINPEALTASLNSTATTEALIFTHLETQQANKAFAIYRDFEFQQKKLRQQQVFNELQATLKQQSSDIINALEHRLIKTTALLSLQVVGLIALWLYLRRMIQRWRDQQKIRSTELLHLAQHDALTGIGNRALFELRMAHALKQSRRNASTIGLMLIDIDHFKTVNDQYGHAIGDMLLKKAASELKSLSRESDTVIRLGGDEFAIILTNLENQYNASTISKKVLSLFDKPMLFDNHEIKISVSIGIASFPDDAKDYDELLRKADMALYEVKRKGRNNFQFFDAAIDSAAKQKIDMQDDLIDALKREQFSLYYQPIIDIDTRQVVSVETLLRWHHPEKGDIPVSEFILSAEESRLILPLGEWVLKQACLQQVQWQQQGLSAINISVNVSALQLHQENFIESIEKIISSSGIQPGKLTIEIIESTLMEQRDMLPAKLHTLRSLGVNISIDDFGTGYSSLVLLKRLPINHLKIDSEFTQQLPTNYRDVAITRSIIKMAHELGISVIAEGIEQKDQLKFLVDANCDLAQGYHLAKPMPSKEFSLWLSHYQQQNKNNIHSIR